MRLSCFAHMSTKAANLDPSQTTFNIAPSTHKLHPSRKNAIINHQEYTSLLPVNMNRRAKTHRQPRISFNQRCRPSITITDASTPIDLIKHIVRLRYKPHYNTLLPICTALW